MPTLKRASTRKIKRMFSGSESARNEIYATSRWRKLRSGYIMQHPLCEICLLDGRVVPSEDVHHKDSFMNYDGLQRLGKAYDTDNLVALCKRCHAALHKSGRTHGLDLEGLAEIINQNKTT